MLASATLPSPRKVLGAFSSISQMETQKLSRNKLVRSKLAVRLLSLSALNKETNK